LDFGFSIGPTWKLSIFAVGYFRALNLKSAIQNLK